jgi:hypothetical protein
MLIILEKKINLRRVKYENGLKKKDLFCKYQKLNFKFLE